VSTTAAPPPPRSAGARYFAWLYSAEKVREGVSALLAIEQEILASASSGLDHSVAHARLAWWQDECARLRAAQPVHPASLAARHAFLAVGLPAPDLASLADLAAARLAYASLAREATSEASAQDAARWTEGLFLPLAALSGAAVGIDTGVATAQLRALGIALCTHERTPGAATRAALRTALASLPGALRPALRALLVWSTLALRPAAPTPGTALADNWIAWRAARAAARTLP
jgi:phytoene synthase